MNPRTLRALLPVIRDAREAGVLEIEAGEGKSHFRLRLAEPAAVPGVAIEPGTDETAADEDGANDPRKFMEDHYRLHGGLANAVEVKSQ